MSSYNKVLLMGNLTKDPEIKTIGSGSTLANVSIAVNRRYTGSNGEKKEEVTYVDIAFWGKQAEVFGRLGIRKGTPIFVEGRLQLDSWEDKQTGQKRSRLKVVGENFQLFGARKDGQDAGRGQPPRETSRPSPQHEDPYYPGGDGDEPF
jgi:single-strand DNA-binding protein